MTRPIIGFLAEFSAVPRPADVGRPDPEPPGEDPAAREAERVAALVEAARNEGLAEGRRLAEAAALEGRDALLAQQEAALADARTQWAREQGAVLGEGLRVGLLQIENGLGEGLAAALLPLVGPAVQARAVADLRRTLGELLAGGSGALVTLRGPADILDALRPDWGGNPSVALVPAEDSEVTVEAGDTAIRTQLQAWSDRFRTLFQVSP